MSLVAELREALTTIVKLGPRPWIPGAQITWPEWDAAMEAADAVLAKARDEGGISERDELIERMAQAIHDRDGPDDWGESESERDYYRALARAAIVALEAVGYVIAKRSILTGGKE